MFEESLVLEGIFESVFGWLREKNNVNFVSGIGSNSLPVKEISC